MPKFYAQVDSEGKVFAVSNLAGVVEAEDMISIDESQYHNVDIFGCSFVNDKFIKKYVKITPNKTSLAIGEVATISLQWILFDLAQETHVDETTNTILFNVTVNGQTGDIAPTNGAGEFTFSSDEPGTHKIIVNGEELEVIVNA